MVIFDSTNNFNNQIKGMLHISIMDIDYLMSKYSQTLKTRIPADYVCAFENELERRKNEDKLSEQYYSVLKLGIETDSDEELLKIIKSEIKQGNLFTKNNLQSIKREDLEDLISQLKNKNGQLSDEELYKLRSYMMVDFIFNAIETSNRCIEHLYEAPASLYTAREYKNNMSDLEAIGLSSNIVESDYFENNERRLLYYERFKQMPKHYEGYPIYHFLCKDVKTGEDIALGLCYFAEEVANTVGGYYYRDIIDATEDFDILWNVTMEKISPVADTFDEVKVEYERMLSEGVSTEEINSAMIELFASRINDQKRN